MPVNGNYAPHQAQGYGTAEQNQVACTANKPTSTPGEQKTASTNMATNTTSEVAWYFVEQYYTTLSRSPEKLHVSESSTGYVSRLALGKWLTCCSFSTTNGHNSFPEKKQPKFPFASAEM